MKKAIDQAEAKLHGECAPLGSSRLNTLQLTHSDVSCIWIDDYARLLIVLSESIAARFVKIVTDGWLLQVGSWPRRKERLRSRNSGLILRKWRGTERRTRNLSNVKHTWQLYVPNLSTKTNILVSASILPVILRYLKTLCVLLWLFYCDFWTILARFAACSADLAVLPGGFRRMFPDSLNRYDDFEKAGQSLSRDTASLKQRKEDAQAEANKRKEKKLKKQSNPYSDEE